ncbi:MAG: ATP-binding protein [Rhodopila sp.]
MEWPLLTVALANPEDIVLARHRARQVAAQLGLDVAGQTRFAASVSEIARNAIAYAGGGRVAFSVSRDSVGRDSGNLGGGAILVVRISDSGPGIANLEAVLDGLVPGRGISSARRLVDDFAISSDSRGTIVSLARRLPDSVQVNAATIARIADCLQGGLQLNPVAELQTQNTELVASLAELHTRQEELERLNTELEDTNRGVVALYAELDERAEQLRQASELKSRFLSNMSHEFRTPLNSILALSRLLLDRTDGPLTAEQERQVTYIRRSAESLTELVNDLLDLAKVEAGKLEVRPTLFTVSELFGALRGMMKPLQQNEAVELIFEEPHGLPPLTTDEAKVAQVLRNLISNALKYTERGEVRVSARIDRLGGLVQFIVADTGIGIASEFHEVVFQEFSQVANRLQTRAKGTGLGLPLSRRLAELLGGTLTLRSVPGEGSVFTLGIPVAASPALAAQPGQVRDVLLIDDEETSRYVLRQMLSGWQHLRIREAETGAEGLRLVRSGLPDAILLDLRLPDIDGQAVLDRLEADPATADVPVIVCTSSVLGEAERKRLGHARSVLSKASLTRDVMQRILAAIWQDGVAMRVDGIAE